MASPCDNVTDGLRVENAITTLTSVDSPTSDFIKDDDFNKLVKTFGTDGRGNRPKPPDLPLTNRLLLQLRELMTLKGKTFSAVEGWFTKLFPSLSFPASRVIPMMERAHTRYLALKDSPADLLNFLQQHIYLDSVSAALTALGIQRGQLLSSPKAADLPDGFVCTNQLVIDIENFRTRESALKKKANFTAEWVSLLCGETVSNASVKRTIDHYRDLNKHKSRNPEGPIEYLQTAFCVSKQPKRCRQPSFTACSGGQDSPVKRLKSEETKALEKLHKENFQLRQENDHQEKQNFFLQAVVTELAQDNVKLRAVPVQQNRQEAEDRARMLSNKLETSKQKCEHLRRTRNELQRQLDRARFKCRQKEQELEERQREIENLRTRIQTDEVRHELVLRENAALQQARAEENLNIQIETRLRGENNRFTDSVRRTVLALHTNANVPASQCAKAIQAVARHLFGVAMPDKDLPCLQTAINILDEGSVLANIHVTEAILNSSNCTLHTDGTSRNQKKIIGQQITLDCGMTLSLGFYTVPTEDAATLLEYTRQKLEEMTELYADATDQEREVIFRSLLQKLTSVMSDRAAVMKKFNADFSSFIQSEIGRDIVVHFLYCNAHFLLGLSRACEEGLKAVEVDLTQDTPRLGRDQFAKYGFFRNSSESATSRVIRTTADVTGPRGDEQNGCRQEWLSFCEAEGIKSRMTSYRSNRFNSYFEGAAAIIHHLEALKNFFPALPHSNLKTQSVEDDLKDDRLLALVAAVAILFIRVTGPYWLLIQSEVKYTEFYRYIGQLAGHLRRWSDDARDLLSPDFNGVFVGEFELEGEQAAMKASVYNFIAAPVIQEEVKSALQATMQHLTRVLEKQLADFLPDGGYYGPDAAPPEVLDHCSLTNLLGENVFGDLDFDMNKHRHSTSHHRSTRHMLRHNKTPQWLSKKTPEQVAHLMRTARREAPRLRSQHQQQERIVIRRIHQIMLEKEERRIEKEARQADQKAQLMRRLRELGGPCFTPQDVDVLLQRVDRPLDAIKDQIRYQKTVLGRKGTLINLTGNTLEELVASLKHHLDEQDNGALAVPPIEAVGVAEVENHAEDDEEAAADEDVSFSFTAQGQWVAVFYDQTFYIGQVVNILTEAKAIVQYMQQTGTGRQDLFKWPQVEDVAETSAEYVFKWGFEMLPASAGGRLWKPDNLDSITTAYQNIKQKCSHN